MEEQQQQRQQRSSSFVANPNRHLKEQFVSNLEGSSMLEIAALSLIVPALFLLRRCTPPSALPDAPAKKTDDDPAPPLRRRWKPYALSLAADHLLVVLPILAVLTIMDDWTYICASVLVFLILFMLTVKRRSEHPFLADGASQSPLRSSISSYRVVMMVVTCLCILAVDFEIFPRRYAKTETYGTSLMDLGVGSFVVVNALVSRQARSNMSMKWASALKSTAPLVLLGVGRLISTTSVDCQVHVGEYGVHWNFFFTLAAVSLLSSLINIRPQHCGMIGLFALLAHQMCLSYGLNAYLLSNNRALDLVSQNKEGIFSIPGYWAMYLIAVFLGHMLFFGGCDLSKISCTYSAKIKTWILTIFFWLATILVDKYIERVSRRTCNLAYVTLVFAQNLQVLSILMLKDFISGNHPLVLEDAFNQNLLGSFLWANILTGALNMYVDTLSASSLFSFFILFGYSFVLSGSVGLAAFFGLRLKFW